VRQTRARVVTNNAVAHDASVIRLESPELSSCARPGQFFHVRVTDSIDPLLRRPLSLHRCHHDSGTFDLFYKLKGQGTRILSDKQPGDEVDVIGPLGNGFPDIDGPLLIIAGGMGVAPFPAVIQHLCPDPSVVTVLIGAANANGIFCRDEFEELGATVMTATDDGSEGFHGNAFELLKTLDPPTNIFCCGPNPMTRAIVTHALQTGITCYASVEEKMVCGVGICRACAIAISENGGISYRRVCADGPVFSAQHLSAWATSE
jgi:dihydroorotate dehydrogenase electron transfer subunit